MNNQNKNKQITASELNDAIQWLRTGNETCGLDYLNTQRALTNSDEYVKMLEEAAVVDFSKGSVEVGIIAGLRLASLLLNQTMEFVGEVEQRLGGDIRVCMNTGNA